MAPWEEVEDRGEEGKRGIKKKADDTDLASQADAVHSSCPHFVPLCLRDTDVQRPG